MLFAMLVHAGYFNPPPAEDEIEQFEITFVEEEEEEPAAEVLIPEPPMAAPPEPESTPATAFISTDGLPPAETASENAEFYSDRNTAAASMGPADPNSDTAMPTVTEGSDAPLPTKDLFEQDYTEGVGEVPMANTQPAPPESAPPPPMAEPEPEPQPEPEPLPEPVMAEAPPAPEPDPVPEPQPEPLPEPVMAEVPPAPEPAPEMLVVEEAAPEPEPAGPIANNTTPAPAAPTPEELAEADVPTGLELPVMPEAVLPPVPEVPDLAEAMEDSPDPEAVAEAAEPEPAPPLDKVEPEPAAPKVPDTAQDPTQEPGGTKPDPEVLALLEMTPKDAPLPLTKPDPQPEPEVQPTPPTPTQPRTVDVSELLDRQRRRVNPGGVSSYQPERKPSKMTGNISNKGKNAVDAEATPLGRYEATVSSAVERMWYRYTRQNAQNFSIGTAKLRFSITRSGAVKNIQVVTNSSNTLFATNCMRAVQDTKVPPIPEDIQHLLLDNMLEVEYSFSIY